MLYLRLFLFSGMVFHKIVWEVLKRDRPVSPKSRPSQPSDLKNLLKVGLKAGKTLVLLFMLVQTLFLNLFPILDDPRGLRVLGTLLYVAGLGVAVTARVQLGKNWANLEDYQVLPGQQIIQSGIYRYIRHPIYLGDILLILGLQLALNSWLVLIVIPLAALVVRQTLAEERVLAGSFPSYQEYRKASKMFIPFVI